MIRFILNDKEVVTDLPSGELLLDFIRYHKNLTGTKIGCREGDCGACTVLIGEIKNGELEYRSATSCLMALGNANGKHIVTVEGTNLPDRLNPVQHAMAEEGATQCGFCTPGFVVSLTGACLSKKQMQYDDVIASINGNICRCTGYKSIERAAARITKEIQKRDTNDTITYAAEHRLIPSYFTGIKQRLLNLVAGNGQVHNNGEKFLGGGTDLYVQQHETMVHTDITFLADKPELKGIEKKDNVCFIGASATVTDIMESEIFASHFPQIRKFIKLVSSTQIRNMATVAGNFVNASPIGDLTVFFLALDAQLILTNGEHERQVALREFYKGYKLLDKKPDEYISKIFFELPPEKAHFNFEKVSKRTHLDIASVNSAMLMMTSGNTIKHAAVTAGGVGPIPMYLSKTSSFLQDKEITEETLADAIAVAQTEITPISDVRGSEEYKRMLLSQLIKAHFITAGAEVI